MSTVRNLKINRDGFSVDIPYWEIPDEGITVLSGPSGSGKSTVLRALTGLLECPGLVWEFNDSSKSTNADALSAGEPRPSSLKKVDLASLPVQERRLGVVFQSQELFPHMTARENIEFAAKSRGLLDEIHQEDTRRRMKFLIDYLEMNSFIERKASRLSGGECQRTALARAVIGAPRMLLLDEPFSALDEALRGKARLTLKNLTRELRIPCLLISHDSSDISELADAVVKIQSGRL